jgi:hypothetical protein
MTNNQKGSATIILMIALVVILAGGLAYFAYFKKLGEVAVIPTPTATITKSPSPTATLTGVSEKQATYELLKSIANWKIEDPATNIQISHCANGTAHNPAYKVFGMSFGPGSPDTTPSISSVQSSVKTALIKNGWKKCTPDDNSQGDYYSNIGPWFRETYIKNGRLLQLDTNFSMGAGNSIAIQFEYK